jgi:hypothetical protein
VMGGRNVNYTPKKTIWHLAKLMFWSILSFNNLQD